MAGSTPIPFQPVPENFSRNDPSFDRIANCTPFDSPGYEGHVIFPSADPSNGSTTGRSALIQSAISPAKEFWFKRCHPQTLGVHINIYWNAHTANPIYDSVVVLFFQALFVRFRLAILQDP
jgi:hypothetical protein